MYDFLYHGGAPGFRVGSLIEPHETKTVDGCPVCAAGGDLNHLPDRVFATPVRLYAKHYASKYGLGWVYRVEPVGDIARSEADHFESYHAPALRVLAVCDRAVVLSRSERRHLYRLWTEADKEAGAYVDWLGDMRMKKTLGMFH